jgi:hypothetical protein
VLNELKHNEDGACAEDIIEVLLNDAGEDFAEPESLFGVFLLPLLLDKLLEHSVDVWVPKKNALLFAVFLILSLLLQLTEHLVGHVLMFLTVTDYNTDTSLVILPSTMVLSTPRRRGFLFISSR